MPEMYFTQVDFDGDSVNLYRPRHPFTIDGITYHPSLALDNLFLLRPMIQIAEECHLDDAAEMFHSDPPTDAELDAFVHGGTLPPI